MAKDSLWQHTLIGRLRNSDVAHGVFAPFVLLASGAVDEAGIRMQTGPQGVAYGSSMPISRGSPPVSG